MKYWVAVDEGVALVDLGGCVNVTDQNGVVTKFELADSAPVEIPFDVNVAFGEGQQLSVRLVIDIPINTAPEPVDGLDGRAASKRGEQAGEVPVGEDRAEVDPSDVELTTAVVAPEVVEGVDPAGE